MVEEGTHHFLSGEIQRKNALKMIEEKTHPLLGPNVNFSMLAKGIHPSQKEWVCPHCGKKGKNSGNYTRFHGKNCKSLKHSD